MVEAHGSNESNLLSKVTTGNVDHAYQSPPEEDNRMMGVVMGRSSYSTVVRTAPESSSDALVKKLDNIWTKVKEEMRTRYEES